VCSGSVVMVADGKENQQEGTESERIH
jgi:hypothetical protein